MYIISIVKIDGQWGFWTSWSSCTEKCGGGNATRSRNCNNPPPSDDGSECIGDLDQIKDCNTGPCIGENGSLDYHD